MVTTFWNTEGVLLVTYMLRRNENIIKNLKATRRSVLMLKKN